MTNGTSVNVQIVLSGGLELDPNAKIPKIIGPTLVLVMPFKPTLLSFNASVLTYGINYRVQHSVKLEVLEENHVITRIEDQLQPIKNFLGGFVFNFGIRNAAFKTTGVHILRFYLDENLVKEQKFWTTYVEPTEQ